MIRSSVPLLAAGIASGCSIIGCGEGSGGTGGVGDCPVGSESCPCTAGGACDPGLTCLSGFCVDVTCETDLDCPNGFTCYLTAERCANADSDLDPPTILSADILPPAAKLDDEIVVRLFADEEIREAEVWYVRGGDIVFFGTLIALDPSEDDDPEIFRYEARGTAGEGDGVAKVQGMVRDLFGNFSELTALGSLVLDNTAPAPQAVTGDLVGASGDTVYLSFSVTEALALAPVVFINLPDGRRDFIMSSVFPPPYEFSLVIPDNAPSNTYSVSMVLVDVLGNEGQWELPAALEIL